MVYLMWRPCTYERQLTHLKSFRKSLKWYYIRLSIFPLFTPLFNSTKRWFSASSSSHSNIQQWGWRCVFGISLFIFLFQQFFCLINITFWYFGLPHFCVFFIVFIVFLHFYIISTTDCLSQHQTKITNMSTGCRFVLLVAVSTTILSSALTYAGPARSFAMAAARASKIPRSIRAPFRNSETMVARGFGKRSQMSNLKESKYMLKLKFFIEQNFNSICFLVGEPWSYIKHGAAGARVYNVVDNVADLDEILNELPEER